MSEKGYKEIDSMLNIILKNGYELHMHGRMRGPNKKVDKAYSSSTTLTSDVINGLYGENLLFRLT